MKLSYLFFVITLLVEPTCIFADDVIYRKASGEVNFSDVKSFKIKQATYDFTPQSFLFSYYFDSDKSPTNELVIKFQMPDYGFDQQESEQNFYERPIDNFNLRINGIQAKPERSYAAIYEGVDISGELIGAGLTPAQAYETFGDCISNMNNDNCGISNDVVHRLNSIIHGHDIFPPPDWRVRQTLVWNMKHENQPVNEVRGGYDVLAGSSYVEINSAGLNKFEIQEALQVLQKPGDHLCFDSSDISMIESRLGLDKRKDVGKFILRESDYEIMFMRKSIGAPVGSVFKIDFGEYDTALVCLPEGFSKRLVGKSMFISGVGMPLPTNIVIYFIGVSKLN